jgi:hypothetical protein
MDVFVQLSGDGDDAIVISLFGCSQDPEVYPHQAVIDSSDPRYEDYLERNPGLVAVGFPGFDKAKESE